MKDQWWRLFSALFLHLNLAHVLVNMWVLWSAGRLTERLYGNWFFLAIYLVAGAIGGLTSIAWNPAGLTVGASGAIFGVLGAFLAYMMHGRTRVPITVMRANFLPTGVFVFFSIFNGLVQVGVDNAAHIGGLLTGFILGWALAPLRQLPEKRLLLLLQSFLAASLAVALGLALFCRVSGEGARPSPADAFMSSHRWYVDGEAPNLRRWQGLAMQAGSGTISTADLAQQFESNISPFWHSASVRLRAESINAHVAQRPFVATLLAFVDIRRRWVDALVKSLKSGDAADSQHAIDLMQQTDSVQARLDRLNSRYNFDRTTTSLADSPPLVALSNVFWYDFWRCVPYPFPHTRAVSE